MTLKKALALLLLAVLAAPLCEAQPGGFPGGRPPRGERPSGRPPMPGRDWNNQGNDKNADQVKKKKKVKEGDTFKVVGSLRDSISGEFLAFVNVAVLDSADSSFVKGGATNFDGLFEIAGVPQGSFLLRISAIGYQNRLIPFRVTNNTALGTFRLKPGATTLQEVQITAEKPLYAMDGEKMVYNVSDDPSIQTGTTEDALQNAPGVEVDVEGNVTLRGVSSVEIWINDKPSKLTEENLKTYLQTLPANALARIETITNPSAKYATDAEAVINSSSASASTVPTSPSSRRGSATCGPRRSGASTSSPRAATPTATTPTKAGRSSSPAAPPPTTPSTRPTPAPAATAATAATSS